MKKKTYRTFFLKNLVLRFKEDGKPIEIIFRGGIHVDSTSRYTTSDEKKQKLLEGCDRFGKDYYIEDETDIPDDAPSAPVTEKEEASQKKEKKIVLTDVKDTRRFRNIVEMRNHMAGLGFEGVQEMDYLQARTAAAKEGYDFQIQKNTANN